MTPDRHPEGVRHPESPDNEDTRLSTTVVARRCACRGWIVAPERGPAEVVAERIVGHALAEPHASYDWDAWRERNSTTVEVPVAVVRKVA